MLPTRDSVKTIAALHESGGELRIVVASLAAGGVSVGQTRTFTLGESGQIASFLDAAGVHLLLRVVPSAQTVARIVALPEPKDGPEPTPEALTEALTLIAETDLPSTLPPFRRAAGALGLGRGPGGSRTLVGLVTGWPDQPGVARAWRDLWDGPQVGVAETAALALLAQSAAAQVALLVDSAAGAIAILARGEKVLIRTSRASPGPATLHAASDMIRETLRAAKLDAPAPAHRLSDGLHLEPDASSVRIAGGTRDSNFIARFGLAAAAAALYADQSPVVHGLVNLHQSEPKAKPPIVERVTRWFGQPVRAAAIIALCLVTLLALPLGVAYARMKAVEKTVADEAALIDRNDKSDRELAFYRLLEQRRWPMTKLLADIASAAPVGILVETCEIGVPDGLNIRGRADNSELVTTFRENLNKLRIFDQVATPSTSPVDEGVQFQLVAKVMPGRAAAETTPIDDFAAKTLSERLYGQAAKRPTGRSTASAPARERPSRSSSSGSSRSGDSSRSSANSGGSTAASRSGNSGNSTPASRDAVPPPPPLTDAQIAKLTGTQAMLEWAKRRRAAAQPGLDEATKTRLTDEAEKSQRRMKEAQASEGAKS